jgi:hypothetical protein
MNSLHDAIAFGLTRPGSFSVTPAAATTVIFDPLTIATGSFVWLNAGAGTMKPKGIFSLSADSSVGGERLSSLFLQGRDDLAYVLPAGDDDPPQNSFVAGVRSFQGRTTALVSISLLGSSGPLAAGDTARVTAVVFHNRAFSDAADAVVTGTYNAAGQPAGTILIGALPAGRTLKESIRPGTVVFAPGALPSDAAWYQVAMASLDDDKRIAYVTFVGDENPGAGSPVQMQVALDSIGLTHRIVALEGSGPYGQ